MNQVISYIDDKNFEFRIENFSFIMDGGELTINDCLYEEVYGPEMYALARAYVFLLWNKGA